MTLREAVNVMAWRAARLARWAYFAAGLSTVLLAFVLTCTFVMLQWLLVDASSISFAVAAGSGAALSVGVPVARWAVRRLVRAERARCIESLARRSGFSEAELAAHFTDHLKAQRRVQLG